MLTTNPPESGEKAQADPRSQLVRLADGRTLGFGEFGHKMHANEEPEEVTTIFYFHSVPGSRMEALEWEEIGIRLRIRIISIDRHGMGLSSPVPGKQRKLLDWPADVAELVRHLGLKRYHIVGRSGGGPYALACAYALPKEELLSVGVISGLAPWTLGTSGMNVATRTMVNMMAYIPWLCGKFFDWYIVPATRNPDGRVIADMVRKSLVTQSPRDRDLLERDDEKLLRVFIANLKATYQQGSSGSLDDMRVLTSPWGFGLEDVMFEGVRLWYGTEDTNTPPWMGRHMLDHLPKAVLKEYPHETHLSIVPNQLEMILSDMLGTPEL